MKGFPLLTPQGGISVRLPNLKLNPALPDLPSSRDLDQLYRAHAPTVARWAGHLGGPGADVEDLVHEIFLVMERRLGEFRDEAKLTTWIYRITERVVRERLRKDRFRRWFGQTRRADLVRALSPTAPTPVEELERRRDVETVYRILDRLPDKYRVVLILFELEGASGEEIAALLGRRVATVWVQLHRARGRFLAELERETGEGP